MFTISVHGVSIFDVIYSWSIYHTYIHNLKTVIGRLYCRIGLLKLHTTFKTASLGVILDDID